MGRRSTSFGSFREYSAVLLRRIDAFVAHRLPKLQALRNNHSHASVISARNVARLCSIYFLYYHFCEFEKARISVSHNLLAIDWFKFPWPLMLTQYQLLFTYFCFALGYIPILVLGFLQRFADRSSRGRWGVNQASPQYEALAAIPHQQNSSSRLAMCKGIIEQYGLPALALVVKLVAGNCALTYTASYNYEVSEMVSFILLLGFQILSGSTDWWATTATCGLTAAYNAIQFTAKPNIRLPWQTFAAEAISAISGAVFLHLLHSTFQSELAAHTNPKNTPGTIRGRIQAWLKITWSVSHYTILLAVVFHTILVSVTGEAWSCWGNYYFWEYDAFRGAVRYSCEQLALSLGATVLLVQITNPLVVSFAPVARLTYNRAQWKVPSDGKEQRVLLGGFCSLWVLCFGV